MSNKAHYKCKNCETVWPIGEKTFNTICPKCGYGGGEDDDYPEEVILCSCCGKYVDSVDMCSSDEFCKECVEEETYNVDLAYEIGDESKIEVSLNAFLVSSYGVDSIEEELLDYVMHKNKYPASDAHDFLKDYEWEVEAKLKERLIKEGKYIKD